MSAKKYLLFSICLLVFTACNSNTAPLPTLAPVAAIPDNAAPTATGVLPPTLDLNTFNPTAEPTIAPTRRPTATSTPVNALINITTPKKETEHLLGSTVDVRGLAQLESDQTIWLDLVSGNGRLLATTPGDKTEIGWETTILIPEFVSGIAYLRAGIQDSSGQAIAQHEVPIMLIPNTEEADRYLVLYRPAPDERAVAGFNFFFDGRAQLPANNTVSVSIWVDDCQTRATRQSFQLRGSGYWQGFAIVPRDAAGDACAVAHFGEPGEESWREAVIPITIYPIDDQEAKGITIGNPPPDSTVVAGEEVLVYGTALNVSAGMVRVSVLLENGRILHELDIETDYWGYWELPILFPIDVEGPAEITVISEPEDTDYYAEAKTILVIEPAPTPTPIR